MGVRTRVLAGRTVTVALALALLPSGAATAATFGRDDRGALPWRHKLLTRSIGLFFNTRAKTVCSAFCVGDAMIATAGHCIFKTAGETPLDPADFRFGSPQTSLRQQARVAGYDSRRAADSISAGSRQLSIKPPIDATHDWALVRLDRPACRGAVLPVVPLPLQTVVDNAAAGQVFHAAFHRDRLPWQLLYSANCEISPAFEQTGRAQIEKDFSSPERLLLHRCDTAGASSGSPLLMQGPSGPIVVGINVGTYVQSRTMMQNGAVLFRSKPEPIANTAVSALAFAAEIPRLANRFADQELVSRFNRSTSSADKGAATSAPAATAPARRLRHKSTSAQPSSSTGVAHSSSVERSTGGRNSTNVP